MTLPNGNKPYNLYYLFCDQDVPMPEDTAQKVWLVLAAAYKEAFPAAKPP